MRAERLVKLIPSEAGSRRSSRTNVLSMTFPFHCDKTGAAFFSCLVIGHRSPPQARHSFRIASGAAPPGGSARSRPRPICRVHDRSGRRRNFEGESVGQLGRRILPTGRTQLQSGAVISLEKQLQKWPAGGAPVCTRCVCVGRGRRVLQRHLTGAPLRPPGLAPGGTRPRTGPGRSP